MKYFILNFEDLTPEQYAISVEDQDTVRKSLDGVKAILKSTTSDPTNPEDPFYNETPLTHDEALAEMQTAEWQNPEV